MRSFDDGVWVVWTFGNEREEPVAIYDSTDDAVLSEHQSDPGTSICFWPFRKTFKEALEEWNNTDKDEE